MVKNVMDLIGNTPIVELTKVNSTSSVILAKLETLNPSGSIKDVMALYMMEVAENKGMLRPGNKIIDATSGNTGISFAMLSALKDYKFVAVMPEHMSGERRQMMQAFGAELILTPKEEGMAGAFRKFDEMAKENPTAWLPRQFDNPDNRAAHREITGKRIVEEVQNKIDAFVAGVGTGGTLMGVAQALRKVYPEVKIVAVEPTESAVMSGGRPGTHIIQGIGAGYIPSLMDMDLVDEVITVSSDEAVNMTRMLAEEEGLMVGISSGANVLAALEVARKLGGGKTIVTILPDRGERYLSMNLF
jgi:cysteine synthase A